MTTNLVILSAFIAGQVVDVIEYVTCGKKLRNKQKIKPRKLNVFKALTGASVHNETTQNTLLYGIQNIF